MSLGCWLLPWATRHSAALPCQIQWHDSADTLYQVSLEINGNPTPGSTRITWQSWQEFLETSNPPSRFKQHFSEAQLDWLSIYAIRICFHHRICSLLHHHFGLSLSSLRASPSLDCLRLEDHTTWRSRATKHFRSLGVDCIWLYLIAPKVLKKSQKFQWLYLGILLRSLAHSPKAAPSQVAPTVTWLLTGHRVWRRWRLFASPQNTRFSRCDLQLPRDLVTKP